MPKEKTVTSDYSELRIQRVPKNIKQDILNIAANIGTDMSGWCKTKLKDAVDATPAHLKQQPKDY